MERKTKICPYCGEEILEVAKKCRFCGEWLENGAGLHSEPNGNQQSSDTEAKAENRHNEAKTSAELSGQQQQDAPKPEQTHRIHSFLPVVLFVLAVIGELVSLASDFGLNSEASYNYIHSGGSLETAAKQLLLIAGTIPGYIGDAASVLGFCGLFAYLHKVLVHYGINCKKTICCIIAGLAIINFLNTTKDSMAITGTYRVALISIVALLTEVMSLVCLAILSAKTFNRKKVTESANGYIQPVSLLGFVNAAFIGVTIALLFNSAETGFVAKWMQLFSSLAEIAFMFAIMKLCTATIGKECKIGNGEMTGVYIVFIFMAFIVFITGYKVQEKVKIERQKQQLYHDLYGFSTRSEASDTLPLRQAEFRSL